MRKSTAMLLIWLFALVSAIFGGFCLIYILVAGSKYDANQMIFSAIAAIGIGVLPFCFAYAISKLIENNEKE